VNKQRHTYLTVLILSSLWVLLFFFPSTLEAQTLRVYHIDVEQGDATLFISPNGQSLLVDSGRNGHGKRIKAVMQKAGISRY
jgi:beta-lactamase superfamily II metal-dependent hydrolase